jgi:hypothetical protein
LTDNEFVAKHLKRSKLFIGITVKPCLLLYQADSAPNNFIVGLTNKLIFSNLALAWPDIDDAPNLARSRWADFGKAI